MYFNSELVIINDVFLPKRCVLNQANSKIIIINFISILIASCSVTKQLNQEERGRLNYNDLINLIKHKHLGDQNRD